MGYDLIVKRMKIETKIE